MAKLKVIVLALLVILVAGGAGSYAAIHYMHTREAVQVERDKQTAAKQAKQKAEEEKAAAQKERERQKQELLDKQMGRAEEPNQVIRGLIADMIVDRQTDGSVIYRYEDPAEDGIFMQPYIVRSADGPAVMHVILRHRGSSPMGFQGMDVQTSEKDIFHVRAQGQVTTTQTDTGIMEYCDQIVDAETGKAMRQIADNGGAKITMPGVPGGSNDDRMLSAIESQRVKNMIALLDILNGKKSG